MQLIMVEVTPSLESTPDYAANLSRTAASNLMFVLPEVFLSYLDCGVNRLYQSNAELGGWLSTIPRFRLQLISG